MMTEEAQTHQTSVALLREVPAEVDAGTDIVLQVKVSCTSGCDLRGRTVKIISADGPVAEAELVKFEEKANETAEFAVKVPSEVGQCSWSVLFPREELENLIHEESSTPISFWVRPHKTSMAVWDIPLPVTVGSRFKLKVGVKCSATCQLTGQMVEILDEGGRKIGGGTLGETPWPQTSGLYWGEVEMVAPSSEGIYSGVATFPTPALGLPHDGTCFDFSVRTVSPPEHTVTVEVRDKDSKEPLQHVGVSLNVYKGWTSGEGVAKLEVPKGKYELFVAKTDYAAFETSVEVTDDMTIEVELSYGPEWIQAPPPPSTALIRRNVYSLGQSDRMGEEGNKI